MVLGFAIKVDLMLVCAIVSTVCGRSEIRRLLIHTSLLSLAPLLLSFSGLLTLILSMRFNFPCF